MIGRRWAEQFRLSAGLATESVRANPARSGLAITGIVIGIVTVVLVSTVLANVRNQIAILFRELGTDNVFAYHLTGDPSSPPSQDEANRLPLEREFADVIAREAPSISQVAVQIRVPTISNGQPLSARSGSNVSDNVLPEGVSANYFDVVGAEFAYGRPITELEDRAGARVAVLGSSLSEALFGSQAGATALGRTILFGGESYTVVGVVAPRRGGFFGENRQDSAMSISAGAVVRRFPEAENVLLYMRSEPGQLEQAQVDAQAVLRRLRQLSVEEDDDFTLSTSEQIIGTFDQVGAGIAAATVGLAAVSLLIGGIGIANVMVIAVTERTREIGVRLAVGARRAEVQRQFLIESALLSLAGGVAGLTVAAGLTALLTLFVPGFLPVLPAWAVAFGLVSSCLTGILAGYLPARRAAALDPVEALRHA
ncbi:MAG: FtsX-like permease family protein [Acidobacteria bacterium]|nr:FtsX-like permease family protein [Acidobacteriota bacterium]